MKEEIKYKEEIDKKMSKMSEMPVIQPTPPMQTMPQMPQPVQMPQPTFMPQPMQMPQMFPMMQMPAICCPFLMQMQCPMMQHNGTAGMGQMTTYPFGAAPYFNPGMGDQFMNNCY